MFERQRLLQGRDITCFNGTNYQDSKGSLQIGNAVLANLIILCNIQASYST